MPGAVLRELGHPGSRSPFDRPLTIARELAFAVAPLPEVKAIGASRPTRATVNDVLLAIITGGLRSWLAQQRSFAHHLHAQIPVSLHHRDEGIDLGNRDSFMNIDLPLREADPLVRLDRISAETTERKRLDDAEEMYDLLHALGRMKHLGHAAQRVAGSAREFSVAISNVPGPRGAVTVAGTARAAPVLVVGAGAAPRAAHLGDLVRRRHRHRAVHRPAGPPRHRGPGRGDRSLLRRTASRWPSRTDYTDAGEPAGKVPLVAAARRKSPRPPVDRSRPVDRR